MAIASLLDGDKLAAYQAGYSITRGSLAGPGSYATGGFAADIETDLGILEASIVGDVIVSSDAGYPAKFVPGTNKILAYASAGTEVTALVDLSAVTFYLTVIHSGG